MVGMRQRLRAFLVDRRASVTVFFAAGLIILIGATALAVDVGSIYLAKRKLQGVADAAALASVTTSTDSTTAANAAITANADGDASLTTLTPGTYTPDATIAPGSRFVASGAAASSNAVKVLVAQNVPLFFGRVLTGRSTTQITATATAARVDLAAFSIGSRLASVQGGLPNAILSGLAGTDLGLSLMDYNALVGANVDILSFSDALRSQLQLTGASFGQTLATNITLPQALSALAAATPNVSAAAAIRTIAGKASPVVVNLSALINLGPLGANVTIPPGTKVGIDAFDIVKEMLQLANGTRQVSQDLGVSLPGILSTRMTLAIGQRPSHSPWLAVGKDNTTIVRTAQTRLYLDTNLFGGATLGLISVRLPLYIELAQAQATLQSISCVGGASHATVGLDVLPSVGEITIADINTATLSDFTTPVTERPAVIAQLTLANVTGQTRVNFGGTVHQSLSFSGTDIANGTIKTVSTGDIVQGIAASLISQMTLKVNVLGLGLNLSAITTLVGGILSGAAPTLDSILDQVTALLGVHVGQADLRVDGVRCGVGSLVG